MRKDTISSFLESLKFVDGITVIDNKGRIIYKYNAEVDANCQEIEVEHLQNKNFLDVFPIDASDSTVINCLRTGVPEYRESQLIKDYRGRVYNTENITLPIFQKGKVIGAVEISRNLTKIQDLSRENFVNAKHGRGETAVTPAARHCFEDIITDNKAMRENIEKAKRVAGTPSTVLLYGDTGTGKDVFAQAIHNFSPRCQNPFIAQNCAAIPNNLFETILFGSVKGAYTDALDKPGLFELADNGTLFLDELNSMPPELQTKLLRVLQDGVVRRVGGTKDNKVSVKIIAAMNVSPTEAVKQGHLRKDLFYRLNVLSIRLPLLKERKEDIALLTNHFIQYYNQTLGRTVTGIQKDVETFFHLYDWPGNVRELQHVIEAAMNIVDEGDICIQHLPLYMFEELTPQTQADELTEIKPLNEVLEDIERKMIMKALVTCRGNLSKTAALLHIPRPTLQYKATKYKLV